MKNSGFTCVPRDIDRNACGYSEIIITWLQSHLKYPNSQYGNRYGTRQIYFGGVVTRTIDDVTDHKIGRRKKTIPGCGFHARRATSSSGLFMQ